jgi:hypothetical protein
MRILMYGAQDYRAIRSIEVLGTRLFSNQRSAFPTSSRESHSVHARSAAVLVANVSPKASILSHS